MGVANVRNKKVTDLSKREIQVSSIAYKIPRVAGPWYFYTFMHF